LSVTNSLVTEQQFGIRNKLSYGTIKSLLLSVSSGLLNRNQEDGGSKVRETELLPVDLLDTLFSPNKKIKIKIKINNQ